MPPDPRGEVVAQPPRELYLEVTNRCNLRCHTCPQDFGMPEAPADLTPAQVRALVEPLPALDRVVLHGVGEPMLNPALAEIVSIVKAKGAHVLFNTNGTLLKPARMEPLLRAGLDELRVSLDAASPQGYVAVRGAPLLPNILEHLGELKALKARLGVEHPRVSLWMTGLRATVDELPALVRLAHELGVGEVYLQRLVTSERGLATLGQSLFGRAPGGARGTVEEAEALARELGVTLRGAGATTGARSLEQGPDGAPWRGCRRPWTLAYVTANGRALPCCIAPFTDAPYESTVLGDALRTSIAEVWNGEGYRRWRAQMLEGEPPEACRRCGTDWSL